MPKNAHSDILKLISGTSNNKIFRNISGSEMSVNVKLPDNICESYLLSTHKIIRNILLLILSILQKYILYTITNYL